MIGNVIQSKFLVVTDYPEAAALSFILMAFILIGVLPVRARARRAQPRGGGDLDGRADLRDAAARRSGRRSRCSTCSSRSSSSSSSRSTTPRAASTSRGRASRSTTGCTRSRSEGLGDGAAELAADRGDLDGCSRSRSARSWRSRSCATASAAAHRRTSSSSCRSRRPRSCSAPRCSACSSRWSVDTGLRDDRHRPHDVQRLLRRRDDQGATGGDGHATSRRRRWTSARTSGRRSARSRCR